MYQHTITSIIYVTIITSVTIVLLYYLLQLYLLVLPYIHCALHITSLWCNVRKVTRSILEKPRVWYPSQTRALAHAQNVFLNNYYSTGMLDICARIDFVTRHMKSRLVIVPRMPVWQVICMISRIKVTDIILYISKASAQFIATLQLNASIWSDFALEARWFTPWQWNFSPWEIVRSFSPCSSTTTGAYMQQVNNFSL